MQLALWVAAIAIVFNAWKVVKMAQGMEELKAQVSSMSLVVDSAVNLIEGIADKIDAAIAADDAAEDGELAALSDQLRTDADRLGSAVAQNTSAAAEVTEEEPAPVDAGTVDTAEAGEDDGA